LDCLQFEQLLDRYLDDDLTGSFKLECEAHVVECESCGHLLAMMEAVGRIVSDGDPTVPQLDEGFTDRLIGDLAHIQQRHHRWRQMLSAGAAAAALITVITTLIWSIGGLQADSSRMSAHLTDPNDTIHRVVTAQNPMIVPAPLAADASQEPLPLDSQVTPLKNSGSVNSASQDIVSVLVGDQRQAQNELDSWLSLTLHQACQTIYLVQQFPDRAVGQMREAFIRYIAERQVPTGLGLSEPVLPTPDLKARPMPADYLDAGAGNEWI
jgi:hypothetical protein